MFRDIGDRPVPWTEESGIFGSYYYAHDCGTPYERNEHWRTFFGEIAETVVRELAPATVLDAGCAIGLFVEALRERGVEAYGVDVSEWAIDHLAPGARGFCTRASLADPLPRRYDLITCIEVSSTSRNPKLPAWANLCAATDRLLLSTSPHDYAEATHVNVQPPDEWAARLAQLGFLRDLDFNATVITPWAALFTRRDEALSETVRRYERASFRLTEEVGELRQAALTRQRQLEEAFDGSELIEYRQRLQRVGEDLLTERDRLAAGEAQLGTALGRVATLEDELRRYELAMHDLERLRRSPFWGLLRATCSSGRRSAAGSGASFRGSPEHAGTAFLGRRAPRRRSDERGHDHRIDPRPVIARLGRSSRARDPAATISLLERLSHRRAASSFSSSTRATCSTATRSPASMPTSASRPISSTPTKTPSSSPFALNPSTSRTGHPNDSSTSTISDESVHSVGPWCRSWERSVRRRTRPGSTTSRCAPASTHAGSTTCQRPSITAREEARRTR